MTIRELISFLQELPEDRKDATVIVRGYEDGVEVVQKEEIKFVNYQRIRDSKEPFPLFGECRIVRTDGEMGILFGRRSGNIIQTIFGEE